MTDRILSRQFHATEGAKAWRVLPDGAYAFFRSDSFSTSARFVDSVSGLVRAGDEPDIDIRGDGVTVLIRAFKGRDYGLVQSDLDLARAISTSAREIGLTAEPPAVQSLSIIPGATDRRGIMPFWQGVLGYDRRPDSSDEDLVDPHGRLAPFWFEEMDELRADGAGTIHLVVWVPVGRGRVARRGRPCRGWPDRPPQSRGELLDTRRSSWQRGGRRDDVGAGSGRVSVRSVHALSASPESRRVPAEWPACGSRGARSRRV